MNATQRLAQAKALDEELCALERGRKESLAQMTTRLARMKESRGYLSLGFGSVQAYAWERFEWGAGKVKALLELHGRLPRQPLLREAFEAGQVDWTKAVQASRAIEREPEREAYWLEAAQELKSRALEAEVAGKTGAEVRRGRWIQLTEYQEAVLDAGQTALRSEGLDLEQGAALAELTTRALQGGSVGSSKVRFLLDHCTGCGKTTHPTPEGDVPVDLAVADRLSRGAEFHDVRKKPARVTKTIPPSVQNEVLARSKGICEFPGCTDRAWLDSHHGRGRGRGHDPDFLFKFCRGHHQAPHMGAARTEGSWSKGVRFFRADGTLIGTAGGHDAEQDSCESTNVAPQIADPRDADPRDADPRDADPRDAKVESSAPKKALVDPSQERDALLALKSLELPAPRAKALLRKVLAEQPAARAEELVRAVLLRDSASPPGGELSRREGVGLRASAPCTCMANARGARRRHDCQFLRGLRALARQDDLARVGSPSLESAPPLKAPRGLHALDMQDDFARVDSPSLGSERTLRALTWG